MKTLLNLIQLQKRKIDEQRDFVNQIMNRIHELEKESSNLYKNLNDEQELSIGNLEASAMFPSYAKGVQTRQNKIKRYLNEVRIQHNHEQEKLRLQFADLKKYEIIYESSLKKELEKQNKKIQDTQDDLTISRYYHK